MKEKNQRYVKWGVTIFLSLSATILFFFFVYRFDTVRKFFGILFSALQPVVMGLVISYLLYPVVKFLERVFRGLKKFARLAAILVSFVLAAGVLLLFVALVLPQLVESVGELVSGLPGLLQEHLDKISALLKSDSEMWDQMVEIAQSLQTYVTNWLRENLMDTISSISSSVISIGSTIVNLALAVVVAMYFLLDRERYLAQCRKLFLAVSRNKRFNMAVMDAVRQTNLIFNGFITGKLLDSLLVGLICFVCLVVMRMPYALLVSVIVGVTNIIPMFGPFLGAIPSAFLILLVSPLKCVVFVIFVIILQQIDGNIIGPRILGNSTGLSALYVTVSMLLFGKLMGFLGMIVGVPLFATIYYIVKRLAESSLKSQNLPQETAAYIQPQEPPKEKQQG